MSSANDRPQAIPGSDLPGPYSVGEYAKQLAERIRQFQPVQIFGEVFNFRQSNARVYFELRDARGALPCAMWRQDFEALAVASTLADGAQVVLAGHCDYYPGSATASPAFSFAIQDVRLAGVGELLAELARLRKKLSAEGLFEPQKRLHIPQLPQRIGIITAPTGKARGDVLAALERRGWRGTIVWGFAPVQDRHAAPRITTALHNLAAVGEVEVVIVTRGGGALVDLFAFCDEMLCRAVAALPIPVIASVGHHTDRTLLDDVAAISASTPTHAAEAAVALDCNAARRELVREAQRLTRLSRLGVVRRAQTLRGLASAPLRYVEQLQRGLHQQARELHASSQRHLAASERRLHQSVVMLAGRSADTSRRCEQLQNALGREAEQLERCSAGTIAARQALLARWITALQAHDPQATLQRGYALVESEQGAPLTSAAAARTANAVRLQFHDGHVAATIKGKQ